MTHNHGPIMIDAFSNYHGPACRHGFFTRKGGVSAGIYDSLNCGLGSDDNKDHVKENILRVRENLGARALFQMIQTHSATCDIIDENADPNVRPEADAMATKIPGIALGVLTADCAPVLFYGVDQKEQPVIAAAHAGWGGAFRGVLEATVTAMENLGVTKSSVIAAIGPCIQQASYEVGPEFVERFESDNPETEKFFKSGRDQKIYFDLPAYCLYRLANAGVTRAVTSGQDTYTDSQRFFSYRRATHLGEKDYGRQISTIMINHD